VIPNQHVGIAVSDYREFRPPLALAEYSALLPRLLSPILPPVFRPRTPSCGKREKECGKLKQPTVR